MAYHNQYLIFAYSFHILHHPVLSIISSAFAFGSLAKSDRQSANVLPDYHIDEFSKCKIILQLSRINSNVELRDILLCLKHTEETLLSAFLAK